MANSGVPLSNFPCLLRSSHSSWTFVIQAWLIERGCSLSQIRRLYLINSCAFGDRFDRFTRDSRDWSESPRLVNYLRAYNFGETCPRQERRLPVRRFGHAWTFWPLELVRISETIKGKRASPLFFLQSHFITIPLSQPPVNQFSNLYRNCVENGMAWEKKERVLS